MGDRNQLAFLKTYLPAVDGVVVEVGSKQYGGHTSDFRQLYPGPYIGLDIEAGEGVDEVCDLGLAGREVPWRADLLICCSVLEHVKYPWIMAENLTRIVRPGGKLYIAVPWVWRYHAYPDDYWRFSWRGIQELFPGFEWGEALYSTTSIGAGIGGFFKAEPESDGNRAVVVEGIKYLPYLMLNMIGTKWTTKTS
jgi:methyltransferase family protein